MDLWPKSQLNRGPAGSGTPASRPAAWAWLRRVAVVATVIVLAHMDLRLWNASVDWLFDRADAGHALRVVGAPVVVHRDHGTRVYLVSARRQAQRATRWWLRLWNGRTELQVDLWSFDGGSGQPRWQHRVLADPAGSIAEIAVFGSDGDTLWLYARGLRAHRASDGAALADADAIQARNPQLAGKLVADPRYYGLDGAGLYLTDADGRQWRIDGADWGARPVGAVAAPPRAEVALPAKLTAASPTSFSARGLDLGSNWLGLLSDAEAARLSAAPATAANGTIERQGALAEHRARQNTVDYLPPLHSEQRYRLWRVGIEQVSAAPADWPKDFPDTWGTRARYVDYRPLPDAPAFLGAGLLQSDRGNLPVWLAGPDSVLVLHRDRLGRDGRLQLSRVAGPGGTVLWTRTLPLSLLQSSVVVGDRAILFGREFPAAEPGSAGDPYHDADERLATVDLRDGTLASFNVTVEGPTRLDAAAKAR